jgi:hypothetical protein
MKSITKQRLWQAAVCLVCLVLVFRECGIAGPTEFSGGYITGPVFRMADWGWVLFFLGLPVAIKFHRIASVIFLAASLLCLPMFSFIVLPGYFDKVFHAQSSIPLQSKVNWDMMSILTVLSLAITFYLSLRNLLVVRNPI